MLLAFFRHRRRAHGCGNRRGVVHRVVRRGREVRRVRAQHTRGARTTAASARAGVVDEVEHAIGEERGLRVLGVVLRAPPGSARRARSTNARQFSGTSTPLVAQPREPRVGRALGEVAHRVEARAARPSYDESRGIVGRDRAGVDAGVGVAEQRRLVAEAAGHERHVVVPGVERRAVGGGPVVHQVHAGVERRPARRARHRVGEVAPERNARRPASRSRFGRAHHRVAGRRSGSRRGTGRP